MSVSEVNIFRAADCFGANNAPRSDKVVKELCQATLERRHRT